MTSSEEEDTLQDVSQQLSNIYIDKDIPESNENHSKENSESYCTGSARKRLIILSLSLENFKSYAGNVTVGPFHKSFSAIVGPNGSGKSNVIDAMLFVFGKRAKQMRLNRVSDLIYSASDSQIQPQQTSVTVRFCEICDKGSTEEEFQIVPGSEFEVKRTAFMNNTSKYFLNGESTPYSEIRTLLLSKGVDLENNRFLILQGEIEQIALMKPKATSSHEEGLLEYLEDIIGSNTYVEAIEQTSQEIERLSEERTSVLNKVKALGKELKNLESSKEEAKSYLELQSEVLRQKGLKCHLMLRNSQLGKKRALERSQFLNEQLSNLKETNAAIKKKMTELEESYKEACSQYEQGVDKLNELKDQFSKHEQDDVKCREELKHLLKTQKKILAKIQDHKESIQREKSSLVDNENHLKEVEIEFDRLKSQLATEEENLQQVYHKLRHSTKDIRDEILTKKEILAARKNEVDIHQNTLKELDEAIEQLVGKINEPEQLLNGVKERISSLDEEINKIQNDIERVKTKYEAYQLDTLQKRKHELLLKEKELESNISKIRVRIEASKIDTSRRQNKNKMNQALGAAAKNGVLSGLLGRLADLGTVDEKYDLATGAAIGTAAEHLVVRTAEEAERCIAFLKSNSLGRTTFIILEKLQYLQEKLKSPQIPKGSKRLIDLVQVENEEARLAFYFVVRDTLVAPNLDEATRLAYQPTKRNRVVTLAGQLIEPAGTISGGGSSKVSFRQFQANELLDGDKLRCLEDSLKEAFEELERVRVEIRDLSSHEQHELIELEQLTNEKDRYESSKKSLLEQRKELQKRLAQLERELGDGTTSTWKKHREALVGKREETLKLLEQSKEEIAKLEEDLNVLDERMNEVGGEQLRGAKSKVAASESKMQQVVTDRANTRFELEKATKTIEEAESNTAELEEELSSVDEQIQSRKKHLEVLENEALSVMENYKLCEEEQKVKEEKLSKVKREYESYKMQTASSRKEESRLENQIDDVKKKIQDMDSKITYWTKEEHSLKVEAEEHIVDLQNAGIPVTDGIDGFFLEVDAYETPKNWEDSIDKKILKLQEEMKRLNPDMTAIATYQVKETEYNKYVSELDKISNERDALRRKHDSLRKERLETFMKGFSIISKKLKELYQMITLGGDAELELVDALDPFSEGVVLSIRPPKKSWKNVSNLSGGEKTLSSLALVFALHHFRPAALYFMDEIDAALDFRNVSIIANYIKERTTDAQFIIVSLRNNMFELANRLIGIYKPKNETKSVALNPHSFGGVKVH
jgi:structural maintenance of chromosome 4